MEKKIVLFTGDSITDCNHYFDPDNLGYGYVRIISDKLSKTKTPITTASEIKPRLTFVTMLLICIAKK